MLWIDFDNGRHARASASAQSAEVMTLPGRYRMALRVDAYPWLDASDNPSLSSYPNLFRANQF